MKIRLFEDGDWPAVWGMLEPVFRAGTTYPHAMDISEEEARRAWIDVPAHTYVAVEGGVVLGTYYLKPNSLELGAHVCNCGYVVCAKARGRGVASAMCGHSHAEGARLGYRAMQYNLVVSTNQVAVKLWQKHGMEIVGTLPGAFRHATEGYVDAYVMFKELGGG
ncbi:MAG: N-acetyltransferase family protein [Verrucomicrobiales bacterium]|nr:GNAT family N-acetyltransferase [Verrucomicrobiota bacterium JB025]